MKIPKHVKNTVLTVLFFIGLQWSLQNHYWFNLISNVFVFTISTYLRFKYDPTTND